MRRASGMRVLLAGVLAGTVVLAGCSRHGDGEGGGGKGRAAATPTPEEEAVPVETVTLARGRIEAVIRLSANLEAERDVTVYAQAPRLVTRLLVEEGDPVRKGQLLLKLQDDEQRLAVEKARIERDQARRELDRQESLFKQGLASEQTYNEAKRKFDQARLAVEEAERNLAYTEIRAPIAGIVTERMVNLGDSVTVNQPVFRIVDFDSIVARVYVPEKDIRRLAVGQPARIVPAAVGGEAIPGKVLRIAPVVDPKTGTVKVTVAVPNRPGLRPGLFVDVELVTEVHPDALLIPKKALVYDSDQVFAFLVDENHRARRARVKVALEDAENVEPAEGFHEGDRLVVAGQSGLKDGTPIRLPGEAAPAPKGGAGAKASGRRRRRHRPFGGRR